MSLSILVIAIPGILTTTLFLLIYYIFVIKCCRSSGLSLPLFSASRRHAAAESAGLDPAAIRSIPTFRYSSLPFSDTVAECAVCISEFRSGERLRRLPNCAHAFHIDCIDAWLQSKTSCPLCRSRVTGPADGDIAGIRSLVIVEASGEGMRRFGPAATSMGDEFIEVGREKDEFFAVQVLRRSLSLDSSSDLQMYGEVSDGGGGGGSGRVRRSFFPFAAGRNWRSAVQPVDINV